MNPPPGRVLPNYGIRPLNSYIHSIIEYLRNKETPVTITQLEEELGFNLSKDSSLIQILNKNPSIKFTDHTIYFEKPPRISSANDILGVLERRFKKSGLHRSDMNVFESKADNLLTEMEKNNLIYSIGSKEDKHQVIFVNDRPKYLKMDPDFTLIWMEVSTQNVLHLLPSTSTSAPPTPKPSDVSARSDNKHKKSAKRPRNRTKITNDYIEGFDLNLDL